MSMGKLLAAGKSFVNGRSTPLYRKNKRAYLPKFGSPKNPFAISVQTELPKTAGKDFVTPSRHVIAPGIPAISGSAKSLTAWTSKFNPVSAWRDSLVGAKSALRPVVQAELSLDTVKVVHNDLCDAEVEVVPVKSRPARETAGQAGESSWTRLGTKFFGANAV